MHSRTSGPIATILMFIPLLAVPLLAVFGIPQFAPGVALPEAADDDSPAESRVAIAAADPEEHHSQVDDLFAPFETEDASRPSGRWDEPGAAPEAVHWDDPFQQPLSRRSFETGGRAPIRPIAATLSHVGRAEPIRRPRSPFDPPGGIVSAPVAEFVALEQGQIAERGSTRPRAMPVVFEPNAPRNRADGRSSGVQSMAEGLTWQSAVRRLQELGIHDFQLEPGMAANQFQFRCSFTHADNPRVTHQFQAEAAEPLLAVQDVLNQIDEWLGAR